MVQLAHYRFEHDKVVSRTQKNFRARDEVLLVLTSRLTFSSVQFSSVQFNLI